jgi:hypothetical protein
MHPETLFHLAGLGTMAAILLAMATAWTIERYQNSARR